MQDHGSPRENSIESVADAAMLAALAADIRQQALVLGFSACGIARAEVAPDAAERLRRWLAAGRHGGMDYMAKHAALRADPSALVPGVLSVISVRLPYWPQATSAPENHEGAIAEVSRYARGRDYHKTVRQRLQKLSEHIQAHVRTRFGNDDFFIFRAFSDSAPVMETEFAQRAGIGWRGKHTLTLSRQGSWHFLGELFTNLPLPADAPCESHCGDCRRCLDACPTGAIVAPYEVDARRCISYLTIELDGAIPMELRPLIGQRIYGCDDCQTCCPWNRFARAGDPDFAVRNHLDHSPLTALFAWSAEEFERRLAGSPIRRIGHERWLRNIAVALGNATPTAEHRQALQSRRDDPSALVREHVAWALSRYDRSITTV
nr:tRNA epoxyqueuosine(34) reductase QueG [uncultured Propionivibrio sp.]